MIFSKNEWSKFINVLTNISQTNSDVVIKNGLIRQMNDSGTVIFEIKLDEKINFILQMIKEQLPILKTYITADENEINVERIKCENATTKEEYYQLSISDKDSVIIFTEALEKYLTNKFMDDEKKDKLLNGTVINKIVLKKYLVDRLIISAKSFQSNVAYLNVKDKKCNIIAKSESNTRNAKIVSNIDLDLADGLYNISLSIFEYAWNSDINISFEKGSNDFVYLKINNDENLDTVNLYAIITKEETV